MRPGDRELADRLDAALTAFDASEHSLPGVTDPRCRSAFLEQLVESVRRVRYYGRVSNRDISPLRADPTSSLFDPQKAALVWKRRGNIDEAFWMVFLGVHFGKNLHSGWQLCRDVYGALQKRPSWTWERTSRSPMAFRTWLRNHEAELTSGPIKRGFGNHRKRMSLHADSSAHTGAAVETYVSWVLPYGSHEHLFHSFLSAAGNDPRRAFHALYKSMNSVASFGRLARFDYLTMVGKLGLAPIEPGSTYMAGATGPLAGARLLFGDPDLELTKSQLDELLTRLDKVLGVGMQPIEDALCNWQKSPSRFVAFRG